MHVTFSEDEDNFQVWHPNTSNNKIARVVYGYLNKSQNPNDTWPCWRVQWKLKAIPRVKLFLWKVLYSKLPTFDFLYGINSGPPLPCVFCGLCLETTKHVL